MPRARAPRAGGVLLGALAALVACASPAHRSPDGVVAVGSPPAAPAPRFAPDGPNAEEHGMWRGYPACIVDRAFCFVGAFSHYDQLFEVRVFRRSAAPSRLVRASAEPALRYEFEGESRTLDHYLARNPTTGLLVVRGDTILVERYQYARNDQHRLTSLSMAKTVTAMLVGIAIGEGYAATTVPADSWHLKPYAASRHFGYGYQTWILPGDRRMFAMLGLHGQAIYVDPSSRLVMVHTAVRKLGEDPFTEPLALWRGIVDQLGR